MWHGGTGGDYKPTTWTEVILEKLIINQPNIHIDLMTLIFHEYKLYFNCKIRVS
jgi:hypothetical protein